MKWYNYIAILGIMLTTAYSCVKSNPDMDEEENENIEIQGVEISVGDQENTAYGSQTRAESGFAVSTDQDPTRGLDSRKLWKLDLKIYKSGNDFSLGESTFTWDTADEKWIPGDPIFFPNYLKQRVSAFMYPGAADDNIDPEQNSPAKLLAQDFLEQNGNNTVTVSPAHIPPIPLRHANSMLDFILADVEQSQIAKVEVIADNVSYDPYKVNVADRAEYMVILPVGTVNPQVRITTGEGARYVQTVEINSTAANNCYCIRFKGVELVLSSITVSNWVYGEAVAGDYTSITAYPTFYGIPGQTCELLYDNDLSQELTFNSRGEATLKPSGRTIVEITPQNGTPLELIPPLAIRGMYIDLTPYL